MLYTVPECDLKQCQWGPRPILGGGPQDDHNSPLESNPLPFSGSGYPVVKGAYYNVFFTAPVSICHAALAAFIDKPDLFRHRNPDFASTYHNLSSIIVVK